MPTYTANRKRVVQRPGNENMNPKTVSALCFEISKHNIFIVKVIPCSKEMFVLRNFQRKRPKIVIN